MSETLTGGEQYERDMGEIFEAIRRVKAATGAERVRILVGPDVRWSLGQIRIETHCEVMAADVRGVEIHPA